MASREVTAARKAALLADLRQDCRTGKLVPGDRLPPMRELAARYQLAQRTITMTLQHLLDDGTLQSIPRVGIVVAEPMETRLQVVYLAVTPTAGARGMAGQLAQSIIPAFESQIARLGGRTARVSADALLSAVEQGEFDRIGGVFIPGRPDPVLLARLTGLGVPVSSYGSGVSLGAALLGVDADLDVVEFDNLAGGREAAALLMERGSERVGYAGVHVSEDQAVEVLPWSIERSDGWRQVVAVGDAVPVEVLPAGRTRHYLARVKSAAQRTAAAIADQQFDAVVCANDAVALAVMALLRDRDVPRGDWPAMVGFDSVEASGPYLLTSFRLPWETVGRTAADLLWRRGTPESAPELRIHRVRMDLTERLSAEPRWGEAIADLALFASP